jgi:hypothetical protein
MRLFPQKVGTFMGVMLLVTLVEVVPVSAGDAGPFQQGSMRMSLIVGNGTAFDQDYTVIGLGAGYYAVDGLEVGLDAEEWSGNTPRIYRVNPQVRYVLPFEGAARPYLGAFYRRTIIEGYRDNNALGMRAGVFLFSGSRTYFGFGLAADEYLNCDRNVYSSCTEVYPELQFAVMF